MTKQPDTRSLLGRDIRPDPRLKGYYYAYMALVIAVGVLSWLAPMLLVIPATYGAIALVLLLLLVGFWSFWIPLYYRTVVYRLTGDEISWRRGVWFRKTGIVPYSRITNVDIAQGPVMRRFGISSLKIQTAGYSAQAQAELSLEGIEEPEELREVIMGFVRGAKAAGDATGMDAAPQSADAAILAELRAIRKLLEAHRKE
ncbi:MAG: PH domain-containing protein [Methanomicrobiaceae archaeon]|nr:PH domain-containing protein [Methanomicrobiaceae archaeon]